MRYEKVRLFTTHWIRVGEGMEGVLRVQDDGAVRIGPSEALVLRDGLLPEIRDLDQKRVKVTSLVRNEYRGKQITVILGLEEVDDDEPVAKRTKNEERLDAINIRCGRTLTANPPSAEHVPSAERMPSVAHVPGAECAESTFMIKDLCPGPTVHFEGRITQKSEVRPFKNGNGELLTIEVEDSSGKIRCTAFNAACGRVNATIRIGEHYRFKGGTLKEANSKYNNTGHGFECTITERTRIEEIQSDETHTAIGMMLPGNVYTTKGIVLLCGELVEYRKNERVNKRRSIVVADADESCMEITVFGDSETIDVGSYVKLSMLKVSTWQEKTTGIISNANAISYIYTPDDNTRWFVHTYDDNRKRYEELVLPWTGG